ncbi:MAG: T9SS type A sorting domain-containing protein [Candidatus Zixiibacteriota bacterium]|nr:MAG: T9SS type A sorting domain-containing protein [candidate division Zixibacteria bacterium]
MRGSKNPIRIALILTFIAMPFTARALDNPPQLSRTLAENEFTDSASGAAFSADPEAVDAARSDAANILIPPGTDDPDDDFDVATMADCPDCPPDLPPEFDPFDSFDTIPICMGGTVYDTIIVVDPDTDQTITITKESGPGVFSSTPTTSPAYGYFEYTPSGAEEFEVTYKAKDSAGDSTMAVKTYVVLINQPPQIVSGDTALYKCWGGQRLYYTVEASDPDNDDLTFSLISPYGTIDPNTGVLSFIADTAGLYCFDVVAEDPCEAVTATVCITVEANYLPYINGFNETYILCGPPETICFEVTASDPENDSLVIDMISGPGVFTQTGNTTGQTCFLPANVDSADYVFVYDVTDPCRRNEYDKCKSCPPIPTDTVIITVILKDEVTLDCPGDIALFLCEPNTLCFPVGGIPATATILSISPASAWYDAQTESICFYTDATIQQEIKLVVETECGRDSCQFLADVTVNTAPVVLSSPDSTVFLCELADICFPVSVTDIDGNLATVDVIDFGGGEYSNGYICFMPYAPGTYEFITVATDECGAQGTDTTAIIVIVNQPPEISAPADTAVFQCEPAEICLDVDFFDADDNVQIISIVPSSEVSWIYNEVNGTVCFTPPEAGTYNFEFMVTDSCYESNKDTVVVAVETGAAAAIDCPEGPIYKDLCGPGRICYPLGITPADATVEVTNADLADGGICFDADTSGTYTVYISASSECGDAECQIEFIVNIGAAPALVCPNDTSFFICEPDTFCFPIGDIPPSATVTVYPQSAWFDELNNTVCFYTDCSVEKNLKVVVEGECSTDSCMFTASVTLNQRPLVIMAPDTTFNICYPGFIWTSVAVGDADNNIETIIVSDGAVFSAFESRIYFEVSEAGIYPVILRAIDECMAYDDDTAYITVNLNTPPAVVSAPDFEAFLCELSEICFDVEITDSNLSRVIVSPYGTYNEQTGQVCFIPPGTGTFEIVTTAYDYCGTFNGDTTMVQVSLNSAPVVVSAPDSSITACESGEVCFPVSIADADGNIESIVVTPPGATYSEGFVCFTPPEPGDYQLITVAADLCGATDADTTVITIIMNSPPEVVSEEDFEVIQCEFEQICFAVAATDPDANLMSVVPDFGTYDSDNGLVCFTPDSTGVYTVTTTATDSCGEIATATTVVTVSVGVFAEITCPADPIPLLICDPQQHCEDLAIYPANALVTTSFGSYSSGQLCFDVDTTGTYVIEVIAVAACGSDTCELIFNVDIDVIPQVTTPSDTTVIICEPGDVCREIEFDPPYAELTSLPIGTCENGILCFFADTAGHYEMGVVATTACGSDTGYFSMDVVFNSVPTVDAGSDTVHFQCGLDPICCPVLILDDDDNIDSVTISPFGEYDYENGQICFVPPRADTFCLAATAYDECGEMSSDTLCIILTIGEVAEITCPEPLERHLCAPEEICVPLAVSPETAGVSVSFGQFAEGELCFQADTAGTYTIRAIADESCGSDTCDVIVSVTFDDYAEIICPDLPVAKDLCEPDSVFIPLVITPVTAGVSVSPTGFYDFQRHVVAMDADTGGTYTLTVIADAPCGADTCVIDVIVSIIGVPAVTCPGSFDTTVCLAEIDEICFPAEVVGESFTVEVLPEGVFSGTTACIPISGSGTYSVMIVASSICGSDTCELDIDVIENFAPELVIPVEVLVPWCEDDTGKVCVDGIFASDPEGDPVTITQTCGLGDFTLVTADSGVLCFRPEAFDTTYEFCITADDGCRIVEDTLQVTLFPSAVCSLCVVMAIETDSCYNVGMRVPVNLTVQTNDPIAGFDVLINYDETVMSFVGVSKGDAISGWEYFTYRLGNDGSCIACPDGLIRLVGIADINNGNQHPPPEQLNPDGVLAQMTMQLSTDQTLGGLFLPISFYWIDCGDNSFSDPGGNDLYVDLRIYNSFGYLKWDEYDEVHFPESERLMGVGAPDSCVLGGQFTPIRCVEFYDGGICVKHPDSIDTRGDVNLNGLPYEIADVVVLTNYFIYGYNAFVVSIPGQTAASDVNADGLAPTIADLVYLVRVIVGDANPLPKVAPGNAMVGINTTGNNGELQVHINSTHPLGAGLLVFEHDGVIPGEPMLGAVRAGIEMKYATTDTEVRVLVYGMERGAQIDQGDIDLLSIPYSGAGTLTLVKTEFATYNGFPLESRLNSTLVPREFAVSQNYPNPFNPSTTIEISLPHAGTWQMTVYNVVGQVVRGFAGESGPGRVTVDWNGSDEDGRLVASGIYFYKVEFEGYTCTRKMIMLK